MPPPNSSSSFLPLAAAPMSDPSPSPSSPPNPLAAASSFLQQHLSSLASRFAAPRPALAAARPSGPHGAAQSLALGPDEVALCIASLCLCLSSGTKGALHAQSRSCRATATGG
ncbi:tic22 [Hordeum vulgare]|nr:tic22 [Hordeum vulgare]